MRLEPWSWFSGSIECTLGHTNCGQDVYATHDYYLRNIRSGGGRAQVVGRLMK